LLIDAQNKSIFAAAESNASGAFEVTASKIAASPSKVAPGVYTIAAVGEFGSKASTPLVLMESSPAPTSAPGVFLQVCCHGSATYEVGAAGITVYGAGFVAGEGVLIQLLNATETGDFPLIGGEANSSGAFTLVKSRAIPDTIKAGVYTALAVGDKGSRANAIITIEAAK
jgi:hypothetical protein